MAGAVLAALAMAGCGNPAAETLDSVYRVEVTRCGVVDQQLATAVAVRPDLTATVAHSLEQAESITLIDAAGGVVGAGLIYLDPDKDIALLALDGTADPLELAEAEEAAEVSIATGASDDGPTLKPGSVLDLVSATLDGQGRRRAIKLSADVEPGDSGAPVIDDDGRMVGMVFATAKGDEIGWAVAADEIAEALALVDVERPEVLPPAC